MLEPVTTTVKDIQRELEELLPSDAILVGHSISNDLIAMRVSSSSVCWDSNSLCTLDRSELFCRHTSSSFLE